MNWKKLGKYAFIYLGFCVFAFVCAVGIAELEIIEEYRPLVYLGTALALLAAAFAVVSSVYVSLWAVVVSLWACFASCAACVLGGAAGGVVMLFSGNTPAGLAMLAAGVVCAGLSVFAFYGCKAATKGMVLLTKKMALWMKKCFVKKEDGV